MIQENKNSNEEVTFYRFMSEMKGFLGRLLKDPIVAQPSNYLKALGFSKTRIINLLLKKDILERNEKILTPDKTGEDKVKYAVTYKVRRQDFERKMKRIYSRYFEKNLPEKQPVNESVELPNREYVLSQLKMHQEALEDAQQRLENSKSYRDYRMYKGVIEYHKQRIENYEGMLKRIFPEKQETFGKSLLHKRTELEECDGAACDGGATSAMNSGQYVQPLGGVQRRKVYFTEEQVNYIKEHYDKKKR